jgi:hypothetical protein
VGDLVSSVLGVVFAQLIGVGGYFLRGRQEKARQLAAAEARASKAQATRKEVDHAIGADPDLVRRANRWVRKAD